MTELADPRAAARDVAHSFTVAGSLAGIDRLGRGHIHDTFAVSFEAEGALTRYVLQRLNDRVFPTPLDVMRNVVQVTEHLQRKLADIGVSDPARRCLRLIPTRDGNTHIQDAAGALWRMYPFIEGATALESVESETQAYEAARAFGEFVGQLADLPPACLVETIPGFHDLEARVSSL